MDRGTGRNSITQGEQGTPWQQHENLDKNLIENKTVLTKIT
ncbi:MAG: hypothetical protein ACLFUC_06700 [Bacteroidales bacterium]